jgi:DNA-binding ferritin-like protein
MSTKGAYPFSAREELYRQATEDQLKFAQRDASEAARAMRGHDAIAEAWYLDDLHTITAEIRRRKQAKRNTAQLLVAAYAAGAVAEGAPVAMEEVRKTKQAARSRGEELKKRAKSRDAKGLTKGIFQASLDMQRDIFRSLLGTAQAAIGGKRSVESTAAELGIRNPRMEDFPEFQLILAYLRALQWQAWTMHWQASGPEFYGDHKLLQRLYEGKGGGPNIVEQIDTIGENIVGYFGPQAVQPLVIDEMARHVLEQHGGSGQPFEVLYSLENGLQDAIRQAWHTNQQHNMSLGLDDLLMGLAHERDTARYLIGRRLGGRQPLSGVTRRTSGVSFEHKHRQTGAQFGARMETSRERSESRIVQALRSSRQKSVFTRHGPRRTPRINK